MIALLFLVCTPYSCISASPPQLFKDKLTCEATAYSMMEEAQKNTDLPHKAVFKCVDWGEPA